MNESEHIWAFLRTNLIANRGNKMQWQSVKTEIIELYGVTLQIAELQAICTGKVIDNEHLIIDNKGVILETKFSYVSGKYNQLCKQKFELEKLLDSLNYDPLAIPSQLNKAV